jgi:hypothetical protein
MDHVYCVQESFNLLPDKEHYGACINYVDLQEVREDFCKELVNTVPDWVYNQPKVKSIFDRYIQEGRTFGNATAALVQLAASKFRTRDARGTFLQGQFGELLLFNFLQTFFRAVPLLRKMPITTSPSMERNGADAIHYGYKDGMHLFFLGEAKTYTSTYQFPTAFRKAVESILTSYRNHRAELELYMYDEFIDDALLDIAGAYKAGQLKPVEVHLVSVIVYNETTRMNKNNETQIKQDIMDTIRKRGRDLDRDIFDSIGPGLLPRFNYIILPIWELEELIQTFQQKLGV